MLLACWKVATPVEKKSHLSHFLDDEQAMKMKSAPASAQTMKRHAHTKKKREIIFNYFWHRWCGGCRLVVTLAEPKICQNICVQLNWLFFRSRFPSIYGIHRNFQTVKDTTKIITISGRAVRTGADIAFYTRTTMNEWKTEYIGAPRWLARVS